jgi:hypothetical protein
VSGPATSITEPTRLTHLRRDPGLRWHAAGIQTEMTQNPDIKGIYTPACGVFLAAIEQTLKSKDMLYPVGIKSKKLTLDGGGR